MARYHEMYLTTKDELDKLKAERSGLERLKTQLLAFDVAIKVLAKHQLIVEFAEELDRVSKVTNGE